MDKERTVMGMGWAKFCKCMDAVKISHAHRFKQKRKELKKK